VKGVALACQRHDVRARAVSRSVSRKWFVSVPVPPSPAAIPTPRRRANMNVPSQWSLRAEPVTSLRLVGPFSAYGFQPYPVSLEQWECPRAARVNRVSRVTPLATRDGTKHTLRYNTAFSLESRLSEACSLPDSR
jgi:hypothetical protein